MSASASASASAAGTTLTRSRAAAVLGITAAVAYSIYYVHQSRQLAEGDASATNPGLHRSNAVLHRRSHGQDRPVLESIEIQEDELASENDGQGSWHEDYSWNGDDNDQAQNEEQSRNGQNIVQLLFRVSEDATRRNAYVHRGCGCNSCGVVPIRGIRYRCANCADFDLCEGCEAQGLHIKTHIFYKVRVPAPSFGPQQIQPVWYSGDPDSQPRSLPKDMLSKLIHDTGFERHELDAFWEQWTFMATTEWREDPDDIELAMDRRTFERCLIPSGGYKHAAPSLVFDRMFAFYDTNNDDLISFREFLNGLSYRKRQDKWSRVFAGYDVDTDGYVDRKDCLRLFRSYYVLYRQMHRDMVEGLDGQQMNSTEAHSLVNSRQPLSRIFGQDGRFSSAPEPRTGEGKRMGSNGDLEIVDHGGVVTESGNDHGNREDLFKWPFPSLRPDSNGYWETMLSPPTTPEQMPGVIDGIYRERRDGGDYSAEDVAAAQARVRADAQQFGRREWRITCEKLRLLDDDAAAICGPHVTLEQVPPELHALVVRHGKIRIQGEKDLHERWKRRRFYTDEEEGATTPESWDDDEDILANSGIGESSKSGAHSRPILHSRSSSKVRFAEDTVDMDDFDTRSNPSTSSRSVPERWGGMEIPDAEKDAGKEILYQVTQQAFNELLDPLFKESEDLALEVAASQEERDKWRYLFDSPLFIQYATRRAAEEANSNADEDVRSDDEQDHAQNLADMETEHAAQLAIRFAAAARVQVELDGDAMEAVPLLSMDIVTATGSGEATARSTPVMSSPSSTNANTEAGQSNALGSTSAEEPSVGQSSHEEPSVTEPSHEEPSREEPSHDETSHEEPSHEESSHEEPPPGEPSQEPSPEQPSPTDPSNPETHWRAAHFRNAITSQIDRLIHTSEHQPPDPPTTPDPTMPQFRPTSSATTTLPSAPAPPLSHLWKLFNLDMAAEEAAKRGGWGRLNVEEFDGRVRRIERRGAGVPGGGLSMEYLASWIEFCIP